LITPVVQAAVDQRRKFFEAKRDCLYQIEIFYCVLLEGTRLPIRQWNAPDN